MRNKFKMLLFSILSLLPCICLCGNRGTLFSKGNISDSVKQLVIKQPFDHFNSNNNETFDMEYFEQLNLWTPGGPIFLFLNDGDNVMFMNPDFLTIGSNRIFYTLAEENNGALYYTVRRYAFPSSVLRNEKSDIRYYTANQTIADLVHLIRHIKSQAKFEKSKVVVMGSGLEGSYAVWLRQRHPELVHAAYASGARLLATEAIPHFGVDMGKVFSPDTFDDIENMFNINRQRFLTEEGRRIVSEEYGVCEQTDFRKTLDQQLLFYNDIQWDILVNFHIEIITKNIMKNHDKKHCMLSFDGFMNFCKKTIHCTAKFYPSCKEFGQFITTSNVEGDPYGEAVSMELYYQLCKTLFGIDEESMASNIAKTNKIFGGLSPNVTRVLFVESELNPWQSLGVSSNVSFGNAYWFIPNGHRYAELMITEYDSRETLEARWFVRKTIRSWLNSD